MNEEKKFEKPEATVVTFQDDDIILTSIIGGGEAEGLIGY